MSSKIFSSFVEFSGEVIYGNHLLLKSEDVFTVRVDVFPYDRVPKFASPFKIWKKNYFIMHYMTSTFILMSPKDGFPVI